MNLYSPFILYHVWLAACFHLLSEACQGRF
jgi:hypothetical protein